MNKALLLAAAAVMMLCGCQRGGSPRPETGTFEIAPGDTARLSLCYVRAQTDLRADIRCKGDFRSVTLCRGSLGEYLGAELELTPDSLIARRYGWSEEFGRNCITTTAAFAHGLNIGRHFQLEISTRQRYETASVTLKSGGQTFSEELQWDGGGCPGVINGNGEAISAKLSFTRKAAGEKIWFFGDSYFSEVDPARWAFYMVRDGYGKGWMADHLPGGASETFIQCFRNDLQYGTPQVAVWMLGMNDRDSATKVNREWLACFEEFCSLCDERGITPVICTIPTVPERNHGYKNAVIRESGKRIIDWYTAVEAKPWGSGDMDWHEGMLSPDGVHPTALGAQALWTAVHDALPELGTAGR